MLRRISIGIIAEPDSGTESENAQAERIQDVFALNMGVFKLKFSVNFVMNLVHHLGIASILALGGYYVVKGETQIGTIVAFLSGLAQMFEAATEALSERETEGDENPYRTRTARVFGGMRPTGGMSSPSF